MVDYKNWVPKGMLYAMFITSSILVLLGITFGVFALTLCKYCWFLFGLFIVIGIVAFYMSFTFLNMYKAFSYNGKRKLMKVVAEGVTSYIDLKDNDKAIDVGCGSGALSISLAKRNKNANVIGIDRWGKEYASFNKPLCENNAKLEGVSNVEFMQGNALKLPFEDGTFDALVSNYVYHNIPSKNRQAILLESLRLLKKGGKFAIHDIFTKGKYGDMDKFVDMLKDMGYQSVELIDTTNGLFMDKKESKKLMLTGSKLLVGIK